MASSATDAPSADRLQAEIARLQLELDALRLKDGSTEDIYIGDYLLVRLKQLGVTSMFGVPGDFNLGFLDLVEDHPTIDWVGNCNELNAAYAADGYARVKEGSLGVVLTTFGVGELSAINGIAGAFSEMVPVLHIAGVPSTAQQKVKPMLHHTLGDGRYDAYTKAAEQFTIAQAILTDKENAAAEIDRVLTQCILHARPVYLTLPTDLVFTKISSSRLKVPIAHLPPANEPDEEAFVLEEIMRMVEAADGDILILVDACAVRQHARQEVKDLVRKTQLPVYAAPMGKAVINESYKKYGGIYVGSISRPEVKERVESAKLILSVGSLKSDFNSGNFTYRIPTARTVELHSSWTNVRYATFPGIGMKQLLPKLTERLQSYAGRANAIPVPRFISPVPLEDTKEITHGWFWPRMAEFFKEKDIVVAETGTSSFGILEVPLPKDAVFLSQILWGSIGWTVGSTLGAALAAKDVGLGRTILFIGDGSLQLTVQELSTMLRKNLTPIIFVLNNRGYTIERYLHGMTRKYNDISNWKWTGLPSVLGDPTGIKSKTYTVEAKDELDRLLLDEDFGVTKANEVLQLVEVIMPMHDAPRALKSQAEMSGKTNKYVLEMRGDL